MARYRKLGRAQGPRRALFRTQVTALFKTERIITTEAKAKALRPMAEKLITLAKTDSLAGRRQALRFVLDEVTVKKLFESLGPKYRERPGGYTRILRIGARRGDAAPLVMLELV